MVVMCPGASAGLIVPSLHEPFQDGYAVMCPAHAVQLFLRQPSRLQDARAAAETGDLLAGTRHATASLPHASQIRYPSLSLFQNVLLYCATYEMQFMSATVQISLQAVQD